MPIFERKQLMAQKGIIIVAGKSSGVQMPKVTATEDQKSSVREYV
jgi:hypothetical protein